MRRLSPTGSEGGDKGGALWRPMETKAEPHWRPAEEKEKAVWRPTEAMEQEKLEALAGLEDAVESARPPMEEQGGRTADRGTALKQEQGHEEQELESAGPPTEEQESD